MLLKSFRVYEKGESGPVLLLLHGGGHSGLSWAVFSVSDCIVHCLFIDAQLVCFRLLFQS